MHASVDGLQVPQDVISTPGCAMLLFSRCAAPMNSLGVGVREYMCAILRVSFVTTGFLSVRHAHVLGISLHDLCRKLHARSTSATNFMYFENE